MHGKKQKLIEELETELEELIANSGRSKDDIHNDVNAYCALIWRIDLTHAMTMMTFGRCKTCTMSFYWASLFIIGNK